ncbi:uncharacterized protein LOC122634110 [Vespula pensylvanica]|uniref:uncharacterized protein LOC122634110 n=1 Tax=Vespula pensylvanica TaxID=30213 RepID=UPI001CB9EB4A|nr:uncharacterized protein LOC122634110 [Vespula pensylvanica]
MKERTNDATMALDSTVRSQDSNDSNETKDSSNVGSKPESCMESKHSKEILISEKRQKQQRQHHRQEQRDEKEGTTKLGNAEARDDSNLLMFTSCGQLLLGVVLVVFGVLVLIHGASLGGSGAGLWAGAGALVAGALGVVAALASSSGRTNSGFSTAHLASSLVALALSNMAAITALTAVVRDSQRTPEVTLLTLPGEENNVLEIEGGWAALLASIGLLIGSVAELLISGYTCVILTPKLCSCLRSTSQADENDCVDGRLKTRNMVQQWVVAQNHVPKNQPIYVVQPVMPVHPLIRSPYGVPAAPGKYPGGFIPATPIAIPPAPYGPVSVISHVPYAQRPSSQMIRLKHKRHGQPEQEGTVERKRPSEGKSESKRISSISEDQVDLAQTYTGLDKKISEEFISIAMDPDRKSKASSHHGSEVGVAKNARNLTDSALLV